MVPAVLEEAARVLGGDRRDRRADGLQERLPSPGLAFSKEALDLGEGFFDRIEVRGVGRQVQQLTAPPFDELSYPPLLPPLLYELRGCPAPRLGLCAAWEPGPAPRKLRRPRKWSRPLR